MNLSLPDAPNSKAIDTAQIVSDLRRHIARIIACADLARHTDPRTADQLLDAAKTLASVVVPLMAPAALADEPAPDSAA